MKRKRQFSLVPVLLATLGGCATSTPEGEHVRLTFNTQATAGCKFLGTVQGMGDNAAKNEAAKLGADTLWLPQRPEGIPVKVQGEAYRCKEPV